MRKFIRNLVLGAILLIGAVGEASAQLNKDYFFWVGRNFLIDSKYQDAIEILNVLLKSDSTAYEGYFLRGIAKYNLDDVLGADQDFTSALNKNPVYTMAYQYRAITRSILGNYDDALKDFGEAISLRPDLPAPYYSRGVTYLISQQFEKAAADFTQYIKQESRVADAYLNRGTAYLHLKDTVRAYEDYNLGIKTNREYPAGYNRRGALYMCQKLYDEAIADFNEAIKHDPRDLTAYFNRALVYSRTNRPLNAIADLDALLAVDPTNSVSYFNRALLKSQIGAYNEALLDYDKVAYYSPGNVLVFYNRAAIYSQLGNLQASEKDYSKAIELYPDFANAYLKRSSVRMFLRDLQGSEQDKRTAENKIAEYRSKLNDDTFSAYADTSRQFNQLMSFDAKIGTRKDLNLTSAQNSDFALLPMFKFSFVEPDRSIVTMAKGGKYIVPKVEDFRKTINFTYLGMVNRDSDISTDLLIKLDKKISDSLSRNQNDSWELLFLKGISQSLIKQYTSAISYYTAAIDRNPSNPFLYINRSATQSEMIDFISSLDKNYQRLPIDSDPASRLKGNNSRIYNYDDAIADLNKAAKLMPEYALIYYNRANLLCVSGFMTEALDDYTKAIGLNPSFAEAYYNRGLIQIYLKDTRKGSLDMSKAGELGITSAYRVLKLYGDTQ